ncbi:nitrogen fixation protein VnfA [mine drainage metagenome]|uniref:Nitrogen fixation protein VnfA n=1 Tax=mine drainage metagenome TaxID=410659 RepID=A0A1J5QQY1_9ZZZZ
MTATPFEDASIPLLTRISEADPDFADLLARLRFCPKDGRIWLDDQRMLLLHQSALAGLRHELVQSLGRAAARGLLTRMGYASGSKDAQMSKRLRQGDPVAGFLAGPQLHALEGIVRVETIRAEVDLEAGHHYGEFLWHSSSEVDAHFAAFGISDEPVCWMQIGYATGYTSVYMGRPILYREVECRGTGAPHCRIIGKPVHEWDDPAPDMVYFQPDALARLVEREHGVQLFQPDDGIPRPGGLVGISSGFTAAHQLLKKVAPTNATVLFLGETGVGKEMFARTLHALSPRADQPFIAINCAAIPDTLVESELFGVERGAFTGAVQSRPGKFERAHGGTIFLDEIGTLNMAAQSKLLRVLQEREVEPVGGQAARRVDVRVVAATNVDLRRAVQKGLFREDLFFRLNVFPVRIPPLRERKEDIPLLVRHFLAKYAARHGRGEAAALTHRALDHLLDYGYPGNVRELENIIERAVILAPENGAPLDVAHLFVQGDEVNAPFFGLSANGQLTDSSQPAPLPAAPGMVEQILGSELPLDTLETMIIEAAVRRADGNLAEAARKLGLTRAQLAYRYRKSGGEEIG